MGISQIPLIGSGSDLTRVWVQVNRSVTKATPSLAWFAFHNCYEDLQAKGVMEGLGWGGVKVSADLAEVAK